MGKVTIVMDSQAGSCGKGKVAGYLARKLKFDGAINNFMSNAGHTFVYDNGEKVMTQHLPTSIVEVGTKLFIGPGAAITPSILADEIMRYKDIIDNRRIMIHPRAMVIKPEHCEMEKEIVRSGSTFKGCGVAQAQKMMRVPGVQLYGDYWNSNECDPTLLWYTSLDDTDVILNDFIDHNGSVLIEGSQGFDLDINYGLEYPHTTSRQCHAGQLLADCGISPRLVTDIVMVMRPYPIRISNQTNIGMEISSGGYDGSKEISWDIVRERCGAPDYIKFGEMTTVTKKPRRVFEMNWKRLEYAARINRPTQIALNFAQYLDWNVEGATTQREIYRSTKVIEFITRVEATTGCKVTMVGTGAKDSEMVCLY